MLRDLSYAERQLIVVVDDQVVDAQIQAEREAEEKKSTTKQGVDWDEVGRWALRTVFPTIALTECTQSMASNRSA